MPIAVGKSWKAKEALINAKIAAGSEKTLRYWEHRWKLNFPKVQYVQCFQLER
jgi:hypothetical protein